jgi:hypothetical protein
MTPDELEAIILDPNGAAKLPKALENLDEKQRAKLSAPAQKLYSQLYKSKANENASDQLKRHIAGRKGETWNHWNARENRTAILALFGVGPVSILKKQQIFVGHEDRENLQKIMQDRKPDWFDDWVAHELEREWTHLDFATLRNWIRQGLCSKPIVDGYYRMFASHLMRTGFYNRDENNVPPLSKQLLDDPDLLDDIDGLFRVESIAFNTNSWLTKGANDAWESWPDALTKLSSDGHVDRGRLLSLALNGLTLDLKQNQLSGYHGLYKRMAPTREELIAHQQNYIDLLCHPVGHVVKFAMEMLGALEKEGVLDTSASLAELPTVFLGEGKGNAVAALKLIGKIINRQKDKASEALDAVCEALRHAQADVQAQALDLLEKHKGQLGEQHVLAIGQAETFVAASNRQRLVRLAQLESAQRPSAIPLSANDDEMAPLPNRASPRDKPAKQSTYSSITGNIIDQLVLSDEARIVPIKTVDELIQTMLHAVEVVDGPDEIERIIDGICQLAGDRGVDFDAKVAPLLHRIQKGRNGGNSMVLGQTGLGLAFTDLLYTWATDQFYHTPQKHNQYSQYYDEVDAFAPVSAHLRALTRQVAQRRNFARLSAPTHRGGWIDPIIWIERLLDLGTDQAAIDSMDFRLSLLRLAPDKRSDALITAQKLNEGMRRIVSFALGGEVNPAKADRKSYAAWITAARCRDPFKDWSDEFAIFDINDEQPDGLRPANYDWRSTHKKGQYENQTWKTPEFRIAVKCDDGGAITERRSGLFAKFQQALSSTIATEWHQLPTAAVNKRVETKNYWSSELTTTWVAQWLAYIWPQNPAAAYIRGATKLIQRMDENSSNWTPGYGFLSALFQKNRPWGEPGHLLLCLGLVAKDADAKGLAVDALAEGIDGRLFDPEIFANTLAKLVQGEWVKFNRLGEALMQVVQISERHAEVIGEALQKWLPAVDIGQKNIFYVLEVLVEAQATSEASLSPQAREALQRLEGSGKAAKLAKKLLQE